jgi:hypothetical protein
MLGPAARIKVEPPRLKPALLPLSAPPEFDKPIELADAVHGSARERNNNHDERHFMSIPPQKQPNT